MLLKSSVLPESTSITASARRWGRKVLSACVVCAGAGYIALATASAAYAQTTPSQSLALLPLNTASVVDGHYDVQLEAIALNINEQIANAHAQQDAPKGMSLDQVPVIGDLLDEEGNFDWGIELPFSVGVTDVMGSYGVVVSTDFSH
ncbi:MAG: hypothetical protein WBG63_15075 [Phormidesmis sp.]